MPSASRVTPNYTKQLALKQFSSSFSLSVCGSFRFRFARLFPFAFLYSALSLFIIRAQFISRPSLPAGQVKAY